MILWVRLLRKRLMKEAEDWCFLAAQCEPSLLSVFVLQCGRQQTEEQQPGEAAGEQRGLSEPCCRRSGAAAK